MEKHGGNWAGYQEKYGQEPLDFSANVSPLGLPEGVRRAVIASLDHADRYPDPECRNLRGKLSKKLSVPPEQLLFGNGAAELIGRLAEAARPGMAMLTAPTFGEYADALKRFGCAVTEFLLSEENNWRITDRILDRITPGLDMLILCEPNNPTGITTDIGLLRDILQKCRAVHCLLVVDECFNDFLDDPEGHSLLPELSGGGLLILRAFTKFYAMAGLRLGYCITAEPQLLTAMASCSQPWPVSSVAQAAGAAALDESAYAHALRTMIPQQRINLINGLTRLGCQVVPGEANYLLFFCPDKLLAEHLEEKGILLRNCAGYSGLGNGWFRTAVRTEQENLRLLTTIEEVMTE